MCFPCCCFPFFDCCVRDADEQYKLGMKYKKQDEMHPNPDLRKYSPYIFRSYDFLHRAAKQGHTEAEYEFGSLCYDRMNDGYGRQYIEKAAQKGHQVAQGWLKERWEAQQSESELRRRTVTTFDEQQ